MNTVIKKGCHIQVDKGFSLCDNSQESINTCLTCLLPECETMVDLRVARRIVTQLRDDSIRGDFSAGASRSGLKVKYKISGSSVKRILGGEDGRRKITGN